jgi:hypothetical protein
MGTIFTTPRHTSASGVARIQALNNTNNNIFRDNSRYENSNEEIPPKYTELYSITNTTNITNTNSREIRDYLVPDNGLPPY